MDFKTVQNRNQNFMSNQIKSNQAILINRFFQPAIFVSFTPLSPPPPLSVNVQSFYAFEIIDFSRKFILLKSWGIEKERLVVEQGGKKRSGVERGILI